MLYFFLSYARGDEDDLVEQFFHDLCTEVRLKAGESRGAPVGFLDRQIALGERWERRLATALAKCQCFVALLTPAYFKSNACGQEWQIFRDRVADYEVEERVETSLLKPILWTSMPANRMHPAADPLQYTSEQLGPTYRRLGLRQLMRLDRHQDDYRIFIDELAAQIVESAESHAMPEGTEREFSRVPSAFYQSGLTVAVPTSAPQTAPFLVHFIVATTSQAQIRAVRTQTGFYGKRPLEWAPYRPSMPAALAEVALSLANQQQLEAYVADVGELQRRSRIAAQHNQIIVLLVDAWATRLENVRRSLAGTIAPTSGRAPVTAVLIPASNDDPETKEHWRELSRECRGIFEQMSDDDELYKSAVSTFHAFEMHLPEMLAVARNRLHGTGVVHRAPAIGTDTRAPVIDVPYREESSSHPRDEEEP